MPGWLGQGRHARRSAGRSVAELRASAIRDSQVCFAVPCGVPSARRSRSPDAPVRDRAALRPGRSGRPVPQRPSDRGGRARRDPASPPPGAGRAPTRGGVGVDRTGRPAPGDAPSASCARELGARQARLFPVTRGRRNAAALTRFDTSSNRSGGWRSWKGRKGRVHVRCVRRCPGDRRGRPRSCGPGPRRRSRSTSGPGRRRRDGGASADSRARENADIRVTV